MSDIFQFYRDHKATQAAHEKVASFAYSHATSRRRVHAHIAYVCESPHANWWIHTRLFKILRPFIPLKSSRYRYSARPMTLKSNNCDSGHPYLVMAHTAAEDKTPYISYKDILASPYTPIFSIYMTTGHFKYGLYLNLETRCVVLFHTKQSLI